MIFIYCETSNTINHRVWCAGWSDTAYGCSKSRDHAVAEEVWAPLLAGFKLKCSKIRAELETCQLGVPYPRNMLKVIPFWVCFYACVYTCVYVFVFVYACTCVHKSLLLNLQLYFQLNTHDCTC